MVGFPGGAPWSGQSPGPLWKPTGLWDLSRLTTSRPLATQDFGNLGSADANRRLWVQESRSWTELSNGASLTVAEGSGHMVHHDRRDLVIEMILRVVNEAGDSRSPHGL